MICNTCTDHECQAHTSRPFQVIILYHVMGMWANQIRCCVGYGYGYVGVMRVVYMLHKFEYCRVSTTYFKSDFNTIQVNNWDMVFICGRDMEIVELSLIVL